MENIDIKTRLRSIGQNELNWVLDTFGHGFSRKEIVTFFNTKVNNELFQELEDSITRLNSFYNSLDTSDDPVIWKMNESMESDLQVDLEGNVYELFDEVMKGGQ